MVVFELLPVAVESFNNHEVTLGRTVKIDPLKNLCNYKNTKGEPPIKTASALSKRTHKIAKGVVIVLPKASSSETCLLGRESGLPSSSYKSIASHF
jgi:hypothetical protein